jgi:hypothetical protein
VISLVLPYSNPSSPAVSTPVGPVRRSELRISMLIDTRIPRTLARLYIAESNIHACFPSRLHIGP